MHIAAMDAFNAGLKLYADVKQIFRTIPVAKSSAKTLRSDLAVTATQILTPGEELELGKFDFYDIIQNYIATHRASRDLPASKQQPNKQPTLRGSSYYLEYLHKCSAEEFKPILHLLNDIDHDAHVLTDSEHEEELETLDVGEIKNDFVRTWTNVFTAVWKNWRENSTEKFEAIVKAATVGCHMSFPMSILTSLQKWSTLPNLPDPDSVIIDSLELSGTQIALEDMSTSTTSVTTNKAIVGVKRSKQSEPSFKKTKPEEEEEVLIVSSSEEEDNELYTAPASQKKQFSIGCNITSNHQGKCYTWKSSRYIPARAFIDLKIYKDVHALKKEKDPLKAWRLADFRCKSLVMNPMNPRQSNKTYRALKELKRCLLEEAEQYPEVEKECQEK